MIKKLIKLSEGLAIYFNKEEIKIYGMVAGDSVDLSDMFLTQVKTKKEKGIYKRLPKSKDMIKDIKKELK
jgi:hypothetical protein